VAAPKVKICGIRRLEDAVVAADAGADYIGLVFVPGRPRRVDLPTAAAIVSGIKAKGIDAPQVVGLFADQPLEEVNHTANACGLDLLQLCGSESIEYCAGADRPVIKVIHVSSNIKGTDFTGDETADESAWQTLVDQIKRYSSSGNMVTLDRLVEGIPGGTGESFDWGVAAELSRQGHSFLLAGGLLPDTVGQAIECVQPWGVDVSSGVETQGVKDAGKIRDFIQVARGLGDSLRPPAESRDRRRSSVEVSDHVRQ
jgi:phosphoribosylanthranilate isomerase